MISFNTLKFRYIPLIVSSLIVPLIFGQSSEDLEFLRLLPDNQAQSISEKLGIQSGRPLLDTIRMEDFDTPMFESSESKDSDENQENSQNILISEEVDEFPIFGLDLFVDSPTTFAPIDLSPAPLEYVIGPGDELRIQLFGSIVVNRLIPVTREGNVVIPEIGPIQVSGLTFNEARQRIADAVSASVIGTQALVSLSKIRSIQIFVLGNAFKPGAYTVSSLSNISNVLFFAGGPTQYGSLRNIDVKRNGDKIGTFDFYELLIEGNTKSDINLNSNDALVINPSGKTVLIYGEVRKEAKFELLDNETFSDLEKFASGFLNTADKSKVTLSRIVDKGERLFTNYSYEKIQNIELKDGDEIFVHKLSNTPRNIINISGEIASSGVYAYEEGLTLEDIIKPEDILNSTYAPFAIIERENNFGSKFLIKANLYNNDGPKTLLQPNDNLFILSIDDVAFLNSILVADSLGLLDSDDEEILSKYYFSSGTTRYQCKSLQLLAKQSSTSSINFVRSRYLPNPKLNPIDQLQFVEKCPNIFENNPYLIIFALENSSVISGEIRSPGIYPSYKISNPNDLFSYAGGRTEKSSGEVDIFTDDGQAIKTDIENTDLISFGITSNFYANLSSRIKDDVFSVTLEGAVTSPGIYGAKQGERLSDVLSRAGGYKENAYSYGAVLARRSVADKEKIAFLKSADQLEESIANAISSGRISSRGGDPQLALASISGLISNLQKINPIGRVVAEFDLDVLERFPEKDLLLEPGDRIFIPERPSTVTVSGQVLSPTSFTFDPSLKVQNYIDLAGGYADGADRRKTLVIYPNGRASRVSNWPNSPDLAPGTTLVIPRDPNPFDWLVFSQVLFPIISNFATSAAAIAALGNNN